MSTSENNEKKTGFFYRLIRETFARLLTKGYYGKVSFHALIEDGAIQDIEKQETEKFKPQ